ncbi:MAG: cytochrome [Rhodospirillaceae bacterium]|nr:cytochrome [Rhodospirillaceae bacterium]
MRNKMTECLDDICLAEPSFWKRADKHDVFRRFRQERPVAWQTVPGREGGYWSVSCHADTRRITKDPGLFSSHFGTGMAVDDPAFAYDMGGMLNRDAPLHPRLRRIVAKVFTPRLLKDLEADMAASARRIVADVSERGSCDFASDVANRMPMAVICDMLGVPEGDRAELQRLTLQALGYGDESVGDASDALEAFYALNAYGEALGRNRRDNPSDDLMSMLTAAEVDGDALTDHDIGVYFQLLITAGIETTASSIAQGMSFLAAYPDQWRDWRENFEELAPTALEELVRYSTPVVHFGRTVMRDCAIGGQSMAEGDQVVFWYCSANRDEAVFDDPDRFELRRTPNDHVGYGGGGPHHCIGMHLARREMYHFFKELFATLPDLEIDLDGMQQINGLFINGMRSLPCRFTPVRIEP